MRISGGSVQPGRLWLGDNLDVLREKFATESVDLIYLDPPFNSQRDYNVLFADSSGIGSRAQQKVFEDYWRWDQTAQQTFDELTGPTASARGIPATLTNMVDAFCRAFPRSDMAAYLVMMALRLVELHRVLKPTGTLYLHCDPTASHYLKLILDAVFGPASFLSEIAWKRTGTHSSANRWGPVHDIILSYSKVPGRQVWNRPYVPLDPEHEKRHYGRVDEDGRAFTHGELTAPGTRNGESGKPWKGFDVTAMGRHWCTTVTKLDEMNANGKIYFPPAGGWPRLIRYRDEGKGRAVGDVWDDIPPLNMKAKERLGYPTQKPLALLERIIGASSKAGDVVLDPFCGCGTTVHAAQRLGRQWVGIDIAFYAIKVIEGRLAKWFPGMKYDFDGIPRDLEGAEALADRSPHNFQEWAVHLLGAEQSGRGGRQMRRGGDHGVDGVLRFSIAPGRIEKAVISVKAGKQINPAMVRDLAGTITQEGAALGVLFLREAPTSGMKTAAASYGTVAFEGWGKRFQKIQIVTAEEALRGKRVEHPGQEVAAAASSPPGTWLGENLVFAGMEAPPSPGRKAAVVDLGKLAAAEVSAARKPQQLPRAPPAPAPRKKRNGR